MCFVYTSTIRVFFFCGGGGERNKGAMNVCLIFIRYCTDKRMQTVGEYKLCYGLNSNWTTSNHAARLVLANLNRSLRTIQSYY